MSYIYLLSLVSLLFNAYLMAHWPQQDAHRKLIRHDCTHKEGALPFLQEPFLRPTP